MPRAPRIHVEEGLYYITTQGDKGGQLFKDDSDRNEYLGLIVKYKDQHHFKLYSYVLMETYVNHLLELGRGTTISEVMHVINSTYTKYFNGRYEKRGHLFQERFKAMVVDKGSYLVDLTRYIHLAPVLARVVDRPEAYSWSSYKYYIGTAKDDAMGVKRDAEEVLGKFSRNSEEQIKLYKGFMENVKKEELESLRKKLLRGRILGSKKFTDEVKALAKVSEQEEKEMEQEAWVKSRAHKIFIIAGSLAVLLLATFTLFAYRTKLGFESKLEKQQAKFGERLVTEQKKLRQDLDEKYHADMVSFEAMQKRLELEKKKTEELKNKLESEKRTEKGKKRKKRR